MPAWIFRYASKNSKKHGISISNTEATVLPTFKSVAGIAKVATKIAFCLRTLRNDWMEPIVKFFPVTPGSSRK